ncbi:MAG TPA: cytochrome c [Acidobacteriota bacterium]|nr:cytochrome c [Acidobacteriota bacterium]HMZ79681.1 cytochrome c [Acidobacteriota bacterium]HNB72731.1 cytochrome c [Acidobacteriota bacterium]HNC43169.1 cytochrome c [Acidobacteriota bacterium]HND18920.1 cytochrome c [Acidobacteriota bacterium]
MKRNIQLLAIVVMVGSGSLALDWHILAERPTVDDPGDKIIKIGTMTFAANWFSPVESPTDRLYKIGRETFIARCASCHNETGDKPLKTGPPLNQRTLSREKIEKDVAGRLSSATDEVRQGVVLYIAKMNHRD